MSALSSLDENRYVLYLDADAFVRRFDNWLPAFLEEHGMPSFSPTVPQPRYILQLQVPQVAALPPTVVHSAPTVTSATTTSLPS